MGFLSNGTKFSHVMFKDRNSISLCQSCLLFAGPLMTTGNPGKMMLSFCAVRSSFSVNVVDDTDLN